MRVKRESEVPLGFLNSHSSDYVPKHLTDTVVEDLQVGEYRIKYRIRPVIFIRIHNWRDDLHILKFNPKESGSIILSDYREFTLTDEELKYYFEDVNKSRIVLIGDHNFSSYKIEF